MTEREELEALRRMAELEAREKAQPSTWDGVKEFAGQALDKAKLVGSAAYKGFGSTVAGALDALAAQPDFGDVLRAEMGQKREFDTSAPFSRALEASGTQPKTTTDRYIDSGVKGLTGALFGPGAIVGPGKAAITGVAAGLGSQAAGDMPGVKDTKYEAGARLLGGLAGGVGAGAIASQRRNAPELAAEVLRDAPKNELERAKALMVSARQVGVPLNASQAMRRPSNIDNAVEMLTKTKEGQVLTNQLRNQPSQTRVLAKELSSNLPGKVGSKQGIANATQQAATDALVTARKARTDQTQPLFEMSGNVPESVLDDLIVKVGGEAKRAPDTNKGALLGELENFLTRAKERNSPQPTGILDASGNPIMGPATPLPMQELNATMRSYLNRAKNVNLSSSAGDKEAIGGLQGMISSIRDDLGVVSPNFKKANDLYAQISAQRVDPLKKGVIGDVAGITGAVADKAANPVFARVLKEGRSPNIPAKDSPILQFAAETKAQPEVFRDAVKTHVFNAIDDANLQIANAPAPNFPKALEKALLGNTRQRQGFKDMMNAIEQNAPVPMAKNTLYQGMLKGMQILNAAGKRPGSIGPGATDLSEVAGKSALATTLRATSFRAGPMAGGAVSNWLSSDAYRKIAEGLSTPEGLANLQKLAKLPAMSPAAQVIVNSMLAAGAANKPPEVQPSTPGQEMEGQ